MFRCLMTQKLLTEYLVGNKKRWVDFIVSGFILGVHGDTDGVGSGARTKNVHMKVLLQ